MLSPFDLIRKGASSIVKQGKQAYGNFMDAPDNSRSGVVKNTIIGLKPTLTEMVAPNYGYSELDKKATTTTKNGQTIKLPFTKPQPQSFKETAAAIPKYATMIGTGFTRIGQAGLGLVPGYKEAERKFVETKTGGLLSGTLSRLERYQQPSTIGEAQAMRLADVAGFVTVGSTKNIAATSRLLSKTDDLVRTTSELKKLNIPDAEIKNYAPIIARQPAPKKVSDLITEAITPRPLREKAVEIQVRKQAMEESPFNRPDARFLFDREGRAKELGNLTNPNDIRRMEDIMAETGIDDPVAFTKAVEDFQIQKQSILSDEKLFNTDVKRIKNSDVKPAPSFDSRIYTPPKSPLKSVINDTEVASLQRVADESPQARVIERVSKKTGDNPQVIVQRNKKIADLYNNNFKMKAMTKFADTQYAVRELVTKKGLKIKDSSDPYLKATNRPGAERFVMEAQRNNVKQVETEFAKIAKENKTDLLNVRKDAEDYLIAKHAPERNKVHGEGAAGMTTKQAEELVERIKSKPEGKKIIQEAEKIQKISRDTLEMLRQAGLISQELYNKLRKLYKNHVPLNRILPDVDNLDAVFFGDGEALLTSGIKGAKGSDLQVESVLDNVVFNFERALVKSQENIVNRATLKMVRDNQEALSGVFEITKPKAIGKTFDDKMIYQDVPENVIQVFEKGERFWIKVADKELAKAFKGTDTLGAIPYINRVTRLMASLATQYNIDFALPNKVRDLQETIIYLSSQKNIGIKGAAGVVTKDVGSMKDVIDYLRGKDTPGTRQYKEMMRQGGTTGGYAMSTRKEIELDIKSMEKNLNSKVRNVGTNIIENVENWNRIFEDSTRLSVYKSSLEQGLSKPRAAQMAKEASINFDRKGNAGAVINSLYMFSNVAIQGSIKTLRALRNPKVAGTLGATVFGSVAAVSEWNDKVDPDWRSKVSKWDRTNGLNIVMPYGDGDQFKIVTIPVAWAIKPIKVMSDYAYDAMKGYSAGAEQITKDLFTAIIEAYNPVGGTDIMSSLMPTIGDIPLEMSRNKSWTGNDIYPDYDPNAPMDTKYFQSLRNTPTGRGAISLTEILADKADIAISPELIVHAFDGYAGGAGRFLKKTFNTATGITTNEPIDKNEFPLLSRFYKETANEEISARNNPEYETLKEITDDSKRETTRSKNEALDLYREWKTLPKEEANARAQELKNSNPELYSQLKTVAKKESTELTSFENTLKNAPVSARAQFILDKVNEFETREQKNAYIKELKEKRIATDAVIKDLKMLVAQQ